mmetsp:Transcript_31447/g.66164  ORF Transcript_31447/g.66164 Transcript_31447/m.66164 type:complete len:85 (-) Transcript_31447:553-807(-)
MPLLYYLRTIDNIVNTPAIALANFVVPFLFNQPIFLLPAKAANIFTGFNAANDITILAATHLYDTTSLTDSDLASSCVDRSSIK